MILRTIFSETLLTLRYGRLTFQHLHGVEIGLAEGLEIDVISEQQLDVQMLEIGLLGVEERHRGGICIHCRCSFGLGVFVLRAYTISRTAAF